MRLTLLFIYLCYDYTTYIFIYLYMCIIYLIEYTIATQLIKVKKLNSFLVYLKFPRAFQS